MAMSVHRKKTFDNLWRSSRLPKMIMKTSVGLTWRAPCLFTHLWWGGVVDEEPSKPTSTRLRQSGCRGRTGKTQSLLPEERTTEQRITWLHQKTFAWLLYNEAQAKREVTEKKTKKTKPKKERPSSICQASQSPIEKTLSFMVSRGCIVKHGSIYGSLSRHQIFEITSLPTLPILHIFKGFSNKKIKDLRPKMTNTASREVLSYSTVRCRSWSKPGSFLFSRLQPISFLFFDPSSSHIA